MTLYMQIPYMYMYPINGLTHDQRTSLSLMITPICTHTMTYMYHKS